MKNIWKNFIGNDNRRFVFSGVLYLIITALYIWFFVQYYHTGYVAFVYGIFNVVMTVGLILYKWWAPPNRAVYLSFLLVLNVFNVAVITELLGSGSMGYLTSPRLAVNLILYAFLYVIVFVLTNQVKVSIILVNGVCLCAGLANYFLMELRGTPFFFSDFFSISTALNLPDGSYTFPFSEKLVIMIVAYIVLTVHSFYVVDALGKQHCKIRLKFRWICVQIAALLVLGAVSTPVTDAVGARLDLTTHSTNGFLLNTALDIRNRLFRQPEGYSVQTAEEFAEKYSSSDSSVPEEKPNVIVIMDEAFADLRILGNYSTNRAVLPYVDGLTENTQSGFAYTSILGGGTANSEYEFLFSDSLFAYSANEIPYQTTIRQNMQVPSLVSTFNQLGYSTIYMHPYRSDCWNRETVNSVLGFDQQYYVDDYSDPTLLRGYISDQSCFDQIIEQFETKSTDERLFLYTVTVQNHGGYGVRTEDFNQQIYLSDCKGQYPRAEQYLSLMFETDKAVKNLVEYLKGIDEPTVLLFYGDHQGKVEKEFYEKVFGKSVSEWTAEERSRMFTTRFFIWANYDIPEQSNMNVSINYLSNLLMDAAGLPKSGYQNFLQQLYEKYPIICSLGVRTSSGKWYGLSGNTEVENELNQYRYFIYNRMYDNKNLLQNFFDVQPIAEESE